MKFGGEIPHKPKPEQRPEAIPPTSVVEKVLSELQTRVRDINLAQMKLAIEAFKLEHAELQQEPNFESKAMSWWEENHAEGFRFKVDNDPTFLTRVPEMSNYKPDELKEVLNDMGVVKTIH